LLILLLPPPPPSLTALRLHRIDAKLSPPLLAASHSPPGGFCGYGDSGGSDGGSGGDGGRGMDSPDPDDRWRWRRLQALHLEFLLLFLLLQSGAASALAEALGNPGDDAGGVWEVRGGTRTRLVPDPAWTSYLIAGADRSGRTRMKRREAALRTWPPCGGSWGRRGGGAPMLLSSCCSPTDTLIASAATT